MEVSEGKQLLIDEKATERSELPQQEWVSTLLTATGLPEAWVQSELLGILESAGVQPQELRSLEDLRHALASYLEKMGSEIFLEEKAPLF